MEERVEGAEIREKLEREEETVWTGSVSGTDHPTSQQKQRSQSEPEGAVWRRPTLRPPGEAHPQTEEEELHPDTSPLPSCCLGAERESAPPRWTPDGATTSRASGGRWVGVRTGFMGRLHPRSRSGQTDGQVFNPSTGLLAAESTCTV